MALGNCRECGKQVSTEAKACPHCGAKAPIRKQRRWLWVLGGLLLLGALLRPVSKVSTDPVVKSNTVAAAPQVKSQPTKVLRPECLVRKANGLLDERECDLVELCKDRAFFTKRLAKYQLENKQESAMEAQGELNKNAKWIADYAPQDVQNICSENYAPYQITQPNVGVVERETPATSVGECSRSPLEIFNVGDRVQSQKLSNLTDKWCPQAKFLPNETIEAIHAGKHYVVQTKKLPFDGVATYEIVSVAVKVGAQTQPRSRSVDTSTDTLSNSADLAGTRFSKRTKAIAVLERTRLYGQACESAINRSEKRLEACTQFANAMDEFAAATEELTSLAADSAKHGEPIKDYEKLTPIMNEIGGYIRSAKRWIGAPK